MRLPSSCIHRVIEKAPSTLTPPSRITALLPTCRSSAASRKLHDSHTPMPSVVTCRMRASILMEARLGPAIPYPAFPTAAQVSNDGWANAFQFQSPTRPFQLRPPPPQHPEDTPDPEPFPRILPLNPKKPHPGPMPRSSRPSNRHISSNFPASRGEPAIPDLATAEFPRTCSHSDTQCETIAHHPREATLKRKISTAAQVLPPPRSTHRLSCPAIESAPILLTQ